VEKEYEQFGVEWEKEMEKFKKSELIKLHKEICQAYLRLVKLHKEDLASMICVDGVKVDK